MLVGNQVTVRVLSKAPWISKKSSFLIQKRPIPKRICFLEKDFSFRLAKKHFKKSEDRGTSQNPVEERGLQALKSTHHLTDPQLPGLVGHGVLEARRN